MSAGDAYVAACVALSVYPPCAYTQPVYGPAECSTHPDGVRYSSDSRTRCSKSGAAGALRAALADLVASLHVEVTEAQR